MDFGARQFDFREPDRTVVVAEIGVNHNGDPDRALRMIDVAASSGADVVKFQAFRSEKEISRFAAKTPYQRQTTSHEGSQLDMCRALELSPAALRRAYAHCRSLGVAFLCAAFDFESADLLLGDLGVRAVKIASSEVTNIPFLRYIAESKCSIILSTGASTLIEVGHAVDAMLTAGCPELVLLHCVSSYPAPHDQVNLRAMHTMREAFGLPVGFSDHTEGVEAAIAAAALGAVMIEKHFTLDRSLPGPDHRASIEPHELAALIRGVRIGNACLGSPLKRPAACERENLPLIKKSLVAARDLRRGSRLTREMIEIKRPQGGIEPADLEKVIGLTLQRDVGEDAPITWQDFA
jgi:N-acetylneuraminate synthase